MNVYWPSGEMILPVNTSSLYSPSRLNTQAVSLSGVTVAWTCSSSAANSSAVRCIETHRVNHRAWSFSLNLVMRHGKSGFYGAEVQISCVGAENVAAGIYRQDHWRSRLKVPLVIRSARSQTHHKLRVTHGLLNLWIER